MIFGSAISIWSMRDWVELEALTPPFPAMTPATPTTATGETTTQARMASPASGRQCDADVRRSARQASINAIAPRLNTRTIAAARELVAIAAATIAASDANQIIRPRIVRAEKKKAAAKGAANDKCSPSESGWVCVDCALNTPSRVLSA